VTKPSFIVSAADVPETEHSYPGSDELMSPGRPIGRAAGLERIGIHLERLPPGRRTSYPHAEEDEEEFAYVLEGECHVWIDGVLHPLKKGDFVAFPAGTGIAHTFINDGPNEALLLVGGERSKPASRIVYPMNEERREPLAERWWSGAPRRELGPHDGKPKKR
jgi:uncharacterized cupin superfamily protein